MAGPFMLAMAWAVATSSKVHWVGENCDPWAKRELMRFIDIELASVPSVRQVIVSVTVCDEGLTELRLLVDRDGVQHGVRTLLVDLRTVEPELRVRAAALAVGEALRAQEKMEIVSSSFVDSPDVSATSLVSTNEEGVRKPSWTIAARLLSTSLGSIDHLAWGVGLEGTYEPWSRFQWGLEGRWRHASTEVEIGTVTMDLVSIQLSGMFLTDFSAFTLAVGGAFDMGFAFGAGSSVRQLVTKAHGRGGFFVPSARLEFGIPVIRDFGFLVGGSGGPALRSFDARVDDTSTLGVKGIILSAWIGVDWRFKL